MEYLHTMIRVSNLEKSLEFFCHQLGLKETHRIENEAGRFTLVFLADPVNYAKTIESKSPLLELTYNWPNEDGKVEEYLGGRNFGHLAFRVDDIYLICQKLMDKGMIINRPPRDGHMAFIKSPDGISIELLQRGNPLPIQAPWDSMKNSGTW
ncbi:MAG: VOC family protein [Bacteriovoracaceae bacterium]|nr:VOC family protein [Bacteriovoracaceae bacterium]